MEILGPGETDPTETEAKMVGGRVRTREREGGEGLTQEEAAALGGTLGERTNGRTKGDFEALLMEKQECDTKTLKER